MTVAPIGIVLAGGTSSRMGRDKAMLCYRGKPLIEHMSSILKETGINDVYISGRAYGKAYIEDETAQSGPAAAVIHIAKHLRPNGGLLVVPIDMPLLNCEALFLLLKHGAGAFFRGFPLPSFIKLSGTALQPMASMRGLLQQAGAREVLLPEHLVPTMKNINTPAEWKEIASDER